MVVVWSVGKMVEFRCSLLCKMKKDTDFFFFFLNLFITRLDGGMAVVLLLLELGDGERGWRHVVGVCGSFDVSPLSSPLSLSFSQLRQ